MSIAPQNFIFCVDFVDEPQHSWCTSVKFCVLALSLNTNTPQFVVACHDPTECGDRSLRGDRLLALINRMLNPQDSAMVGLAREGLRVSNCWSLTTLRATDAPGAA